MIPFLCKLIRKPLFRSTNVDYVDSSRMQWGNSWEEFSSDTMVLLEDMGNEPYYTLSLLGIINGIPWFRDRWRLAVRDVHNYGTGKPLDYSDAYFKILTVESLKTDPTFRPPVNQ